MAHRVSLVVVLLAAGCGDHATVEPEPDGGVPPGSLERLDWRTTRGAPLAVSDPATVPAGELFALAGERFVTRHACDGPSCDYVWRFLDGAEDVRMSDQVAATSTIVSADGASALLVATDEMEACAADGGSFPVARGRLQLLDLATAAAPFALDLRTNLWSGQAFSPSGDLFFATPLPAGACSIATTGRRAAAAPFAAPPGLEANTELVLAAAPRRWIALRLGGPTGSLAGTLDPQTAGSFAPLGPINRFHTSRGWFHGHDGFGELTQEVVSVAPDGAVHRTELRDEDWIAVGATGRWIRACTANPQADGHRRCRVVDAAGEVAAGDIRVTLPHANDVVALAAGAVVFVGPTDDGDVALQRLELRSGRRDVLHRGDGELRALGGGDAALFLQDGAAWLVEADREELLATGVRHAITIPAIDNREPGRQDQVAVLAIANAGGALDLAFFDLTTRRMATVTARAALRAPFGWDGSCGQPGIVRHGGNTFEALFQDAGYLFFVEDGEPAALSIVPLDLSSPPRRVTTLAGDLAGCHAPLVSPDGTRVGFAEDTGGDGMRVSIARLAP